MIKRKCLVCGKEFYTTPYYIKHGWGKTCSMICNGKIRQRVKAKKCLICNKSYFSYFKKQKYCSKKCFGISYKGFKHSEKTRKEFSKNNKGEKCHFWNGGKTKHGNGYIYIFNPKHPFAVNGIYVFEHRLVMEKHIGRYLKPEEVVHHINEIKSDNRIENLMLFSSNSEHMKFHIKSLNLSNHPVAENQE